MPKPLPTGTVVYVVDPNHFEIIEGTVQTDPGDEHIWISYVPTGAKQLGVFFTGPHRWAKTFSAARKLAVTMIDERIHALQSETDALRLQKASLIKR